MRKVSFYALVFGAFVAFGFLGSLVNSIGSATFGTEVHIVASLTEAITTKLFPIAAIYLLGVSVFAFIFFLCAFMILITPETFPNFVPALAILSAVPATATIFSDRDVPKVGYDAWGLGAFGGLVFGLLELYIRNWDGGEFYVLFWRDPAFYVGQFLPVVYHVWEGFVVIGAFLTVVSREDRTWWFLAGALGVATATHIIWNTWLVDQTWIFDTWEMILT